MADLIVPFIDPGNRILDIGCGAGKLGEAVLDHHNCPLGIIYLGLEKARRGDEFIKVIQHQEGPLPFEDKEFDLVILADVLHHEENEEQLLNEAIRVAKRFVVIKEHKPEGFLGFFRICVMDWAANRPFPVKLLHRYHTLPEWYEIFKKTNLIPVQEKVSIDLYPHFYNRIFGKRLHYFVVLKRG